MIWLMGNQKNLAKRTQSDKYLRDKAFKIASDPKYDGYQRGLASVVYKFFDKKSAGSGVATFANNSAQHKQLAEELNKPMIRNFKKKKFILDLQAIFGVLI